MPDSHAIRSAILNDLKAVNHVSLTKYETVESLHDFFVQPSEELSLTFKNVLHSISGNCELFSSTTEALTYVKSLVGKDLVYCNSKELQDLLFSNAIVHDSNNETSKQAKYSFTTCEALSARTASVIVSSQQIIGRRAIAAPEIHIVLAYQNQLYADLSESLSYIEQKYGTLYPSQVTVITGPSRTADIEKTLVLGAHGPKKLYVLIVKK